MGEANESRSSSSRAMENLSFQIEKYPRDLLQRFMSGSTTQQSQYRAANEEEETEEEMELNLGLSLGGRFGVDKHAKKKLTRSSSIAGTLPIVRDDDALTPPPAVYPSLMRASSLPTATEEEWRKRKELQTLRRMAAKRRRSEKQRGSKMEVSLEDERRELGVSRGPNSTGVAPPFGMSSWGAAARQALLGGGVDKGKSGGFLQGLLQQSSQASVESQGGSSSGMSELESKPAIQGSSSGGEARSTGSNQSLQDRINQGAMGSSGTKTSENIICRSRLQMENASKKPDPAENRMRGANVNAMENMPCVFTEGDGPNGKRVDGILYKYGKGEDVRIMCVCHGSFLSPAEFVKHAGGANIDHPLRRIVVNTSSTSFS